jgi:hypothetical protein
VAYEGGHFMAMPENILCQLELQAFAIVHYEAQDNNDRVMREENL